MQLMTVKSVGPSFRRAGIHFTRDGIDLDVATLTQEQIAAIIQERNLVIVGVDPAELAQARETLAASLSIDGALATHSAKQAAQREADGQNADGAAASGDTGDALDAAGAAAQQGADSASTSDTAGSQSEGATASDTAATPPTDKAGKRTAKSPAKGKA